MNLFTYYSRSFIASGNDIRATNYLRHINNVCTVLSSNIIIHGLVSGLNRGVYDYDLISHITASWQSNRTYILLSSGSTNLIRVYLPDCPLADSVKHEICLETAKVIKSLLECGRFPHEYIEDNESAPGALRVRHRRGLEEPAYNSEPIIDKEVLEDTFTCNMLVDRIKNCDTICSGEKKVKIIVREDDNKMMITNVKFDNNILIIDVDDVKMKEFSGFKFSKDLCEQLKSLSDTYTINSDDIDISRLSFTPTPTYYAETLASAASNNIARVF